MQQKHFRSAEDSLKTDQLRNQDLPNGVISSLCTKSITEFKDKKFSSKGWNRLSFLFKSVNIVGVVNETQEDQEKSWKYT
jgi:hypothetical protein